MNPFLVAERITAGYQGRPVITDVNVAIDHNKIMACIGHNGSGKSTLLKALYGLIPLWSGCLNVEDVPVTPSPDEMHARGIGYIPQGNRVYPSLTVYENLLCATARIKGRTAKRQAIDEIIDFFPTLSLILKQGASTLSGGQRQILALARGLVCSPRFLLIDEPLAGLDPHMISHALEVLRKMHAERGVGALIVEHHVQSILTIAHRVIVMRRGEISFMGAVDDVRDEQHLRAVYL